MFGIDFGYTTFAFLIFFAVVVILYWVTPRKYRYITLLIASLAFYALLSWQSLFFIAGTIVSMYFFARAISKNASESKAYIQEHKGEMSLEEKKSYKEKNRKIRKRYMVLAVVINLLMLGVMKYTDFMIGNINGIIHWFNPNFSFAFLHLFLPLGISFYVFQAIAYIVDVYWGRIEAEANFAKFALFLCYFPKVMQGPIVRYDEMKEALFGEHVFDYDTFAMGLIRAAWGYFKKLVIADTLITFIKFGFGYVDELSNIEAFLVILFYFIQDYCDFSGYMDISIGISQSMGVKLPENFARPYLSRGIDEYWRRWHMTLGAWFKDYVFYPLSISKLSLNIGRASKKVMPEFGKKIPAVFGLIIVWFLTGLWHGASWNYVLWGLYYGAIIILSVAFDPLIKKFYASTHIKEKKVLGKLWAVFQWLRTILLLAIGKIIFMAPSVEEAWKLVAKMFAFGDYDVTITNVNNQIGYISMIVALVCFIAVVVVDLIEEFKLKGELLLPYFYKKPLYVRWPLLLALLVIIIWFGYYGSGLQHFEFGYAQF